MIWHDHEFVESDGRKPLRETMPGAKHKFANVPQATLIIDDITQAQARSCTQTVTK